MSFIKALAGFFAFGTLMALLAAFTLLFKNHKLNAVWHINPDGHEAFLKIGNWSFLILAVVACLCGAGAVGLWQRKVWGYRIAILLLLLNLIGDIANIAFRADFRAAIGIPVTLILLYFLVRSKREVAYA